MLPEVSRERCQEEEPLASSRSGVGGSSPLPAALLERGQDGRLVTRVGAKAAVGRNPPAFRVTFQQDWRPPPSPLL